jgi:hypothetical protein
MRFPRPLSLLVRVFVASFVWASVWSGAALASAAPSTVADSSPREPSAERRVSPRDGRSDREKNDPALPAQPQRAGAAGEPPVLERQIHSRFALLNECPVEVARHQRIAPAALKARRLTLRWTILPNGRVADTAVVATSPVDGRVMDCVKRQMSLWSFTQPDGPLRLERPFTFSGGGGVQRKP